MNFLKVLLISSPLFINLIIFAQEGANRTNDKQVILPEILLTEEGKRIENVEDWENIRRLELLRLNIVLICYYNILKNLFMENLILTSFQ